MKADLRRAQTHGNPTGHPSYNVRRDDRNIRLGIYAFQQEGLEPGSLIQSQCRN